MTVASASLVEKKQDAAQSENVEMENSNEASQDAPADGAQEANGPDCQEVRDDDMHAEQQRQSWTQRVGHWFSGVCVGSVVRRGVCCAPSAAAQQTPRSLRLPHPYSFAQCFHQAFVLPFEDTDCNFR